jgi:hypothetical protein
MTREEQILWVLKLRGRSTATASLARPGCAAATPAACSSKCSTRASSAARGRRATTSMPTAPERLFARLPRSCLSTRGPMCPAAFLCWGGMSDLSGARERAQDGIERAVEHADRVSPGWSDLALFHLQRDVRHRAAPFTIEKVRLDIAPLLPEPTDGRAWGAVTQAAIRRGVIVRTGQFAPAVSSNGSPKPLYRAGNV